MRPASRLLGSMVYGWPDAYKKARAADQILRQRLDRLGLRFDAIRVEFLGANACHGIACGGASRRRLSRIWPK